MSPLSLIGTGCRSEDSAKTRHSRRTGQEKQTSLAASSLEESPLRRREPDSGKKRATSTSAHAACFVHSGISESVRIRHSPDLRERSLEERIEEPTRARTEPAISRRWGSDAAEMQQNPSAHTRIPRNAVAVVVRSELGFSVFALLERFPGFP